MSKKSEAVKRWRKNFKQKIIDGYGGKCMSCGYDKCNSALELHHVNPKLKELSFGRIVANPKSFATIVSEIKKCVLVCSNCHREIHAGIRLCPEQREFIVPEFKRIQTMDKCPVCGKEKNSFQKTCSRTCAAKLSGKVDWDNVNLESRLKFQSISEIADSLDVTYTAVVKRMKKLGIYKKRCN